MASTSKVYVCIGRTFNVGQYESIKVEHGEEITLQPGENGQLVRLELVSKLQQMVEITGKALIDKVQAERSGKSGVVPA